MALLELRNIRQVYGDAASGVVALDGVDLDIERGEMLAIVGASGSGKSTLLNILGCLDTATGGSYRVAGAEVQGLDAEERARLRREHFGFIFQKYHLLGRQSALANVELPGIYADLPRAARRQRASDLLAQLGLSARSTHRPAMLSGGEQQRVSIARALMNGGQVLLADEPTGALDSRTGAQVLQLMEDLNRAGHTIIVVTHDRAVASAMPRIVEMHDGRIVSDTRAVRSDRQPTDSGAPRGGHPAAPAVAPAGPETSGVAQRTGFSAWFGRAVSAASMGVESLRRHRLRTALSVIGICIGVAAVVSTVAVGDAVNDVYRTVFGDQLTGKVFIGSGSPELAPGVAPRPFDEEDIAAILSVPGVKEVTPQRRFDTPMYEGRRQTSGNVRASLPGDIRMALGKITAGRDISDWDVESRAKVAVIDATLVDDLFVDDQDPVNKQIMVAGTPFLIVGMTGKRHSNFNIGDTWHGLFIPTSTFEASIGATSKVNVIFATLRPGFEPKAAEKIFEPILKARHGRKDFSMDDASEFLGKASQFLVVLQSVFLGIAGLSLLVGGIGIMNIMLVSVAERIEEIGVRMAVGARPGDVRTQFLVEAIILCLTGGFAGILLFLVAALAFNSIQDGLHIGISIGAVLVAITVSTTIGILFGFVPARNASYLTPVRALARE